MLVTDWIRACVSGETVDGRKISKSQIKEMGKSYNPELYLSKIWLEHLRGVIPDNILKSLGDVKAAKSEEITEGELAGCLALYVKLAPSDELIRLVRSGQKTHLSIEMHPEFPHTKGAYLMGIGVTDSPASVGTGIMSFNAGNRKQNLFSEPVLCDLSSELEASKMGGDDLSEIKKILIEMSRKPQKTKKFNKKKFVKASKFKKLNNDYKKLKNEFEAFMNEEMPKPQAPEHGTGKHTDDPWNFS